MSDEPAPHQPAQLTDVPAGKEDLFDRAARALPAGVRAAWLLWVPGRIEFLGKHTDYAGGRSLVCPVDRGLALAVAPRSDRRFVLWDAVLRESAQCVLDAAAPVPAGHWSTYPATVARRVARNFPGAQGADVAFASDLPMAAGMSSSSAMIVGGFLALSAANELPRHEAYRAAIHGPEELAGYLGTVENGQSYPGLPGDLGVGTFGGSEDHTAMLCGRRGALVQYSYAPVRFERAVALPGDHTFAVAASGVVAEKTGAARERYNALSRATSDLLRIWRSGTGRDDATLAAALSSSPGAADRLRDLLAELVTQSARAGFEAAARAGTGMPPTLLSARLEHFLLESNELVPLAGDALARGRLTELGRLVERSQGAAERLLGNQVAETSWLAREARRLGAVTASAFGAGFGGSVWALVPDAAAAEFLARWRAAYGRAFPRRAAVARFFVASAGTPAATTGL